jgi:hypothetical protein
LEADAVALLVGGAGRGLTVLCTIQEPALLAALASIVGPMGVVIAAGAEPVSGDGWSAVRCAPARAIPLRSHVVDAAVIAETAEVEDLVDEVRRAIAPGGEVRVLLTGAGDAGAALRGASLRRQRVEGHVLIAR